MLEGPAPTHTAGSNVEMAKPILIRAGLVIDGTGGMRRNADLLLSGGKVAELGPTGSLKSPPGTLVIDARNGTAIPGLIDCHFHVTYSGHIGIQQLEWPMSLELAAIYAGVNAAKALDCGYTSALDVGCRGTIGPAAKEAIRKGVVRGPDLRVSGQIITTVGGPLDVWPSSMQMEQRSRLTWLVSGVEEIRRVIRLQKKDGVDNVKCQISSSTVLAKQTGRASVFSDEELQAATQLAHDLGLSAAAHAEGPEAIAAAISAGFDTIQHASFIDDATIDLLERHPESRLVFTLGVYDDILRNGPALGYPPEGLARVASTWDDMVASVRHAYERGVPFAVGSDAGGATHPHGRYARDIVLLVRSCGIPVERAIGAATGYAARAAWFPAVGELRPGQDADVTIVAGDLSRSVELIEEESLVRLVFQKGRLVKGTTRDMAGNPTDE